MVARMELIEVSALIPSSYKAKSGLPIMLATLAGGRLTPDAAWGLEQLYRAIAPESPFTVTDCYRDPETQRKARIRYLRWVSAGKPAVGTPAWNDKTMKADFVAEPGQSFHNAGRAIDFSIGALKVPLARVWEIAIPLGWSPVIEKPDTTASEAWHLDFMGPWAPVKQRLGYTQAAIAACLDIGYGHNGSTTEMFIQAQLQRLGHDIGKIDGILGKKTQAAIASRGLMGSPQAIAEALSILE